MTVRDFPEHPSGPFDPPPETFTDREGREIAIHRYGEGPPDDEDAEFEAMVSMYAAFDPADRAQGIPPTADDRIRRWLSGLLSEESVNVVAWHGTEAAGHAMLVPGTDEDGYELAIFVLQNYQRAGIGSRLIRRLLGAGEVAGIKRVWLTVEHWNTPAIGLYKAVGFETTDTESFERIMALRLASP